MKEILQKDLEMGNAGLQWFVKLCLYIHILFHNFFFKYMITFLQKRVFYTSEFLLILVLMGENMKH